LKVTSSPASNGTHCTDFYSIRVLGEIIVTLKGKQD
jgi:hypothetical protein